WDSYRDMVLRIALLNETELEFHEMGIFSSKTALEREMVYNHGFDFTIYLVERFGENVLAEITRALGRSGSYRIDRALEEVTGRSGIELYTDWIEDRREFYYRAIEHMNFSKTTGVVTDGYFNFHPTLSPDGNTVAYLSNRGGKESSTKLYLMSKDTTEKWVAVSIPGRMAEFSKSVYSCGFHDNPLIERIHSSFSFSPEGGRLVFARNQVNERGELYDDLFIYDLERKSVRRLTDSKRVSDPAWSPDGKRIAAVRQQQGSTNLVLIDAESGKLTPLTDNRHGEQVYTPSWSPDGETIYYSYFDRGSRSIHRYNLDDSSSSPILEHPSVNYRDPEISRDSRYLYFSADPDGIYNIYRLPLDGGEIEQLTSLPGGGFMPEVDGEQLYFSEYRKGGYKISKISLLSETGKFSPYQPPYTDRTASHDAADPAAGRNHTGTIKTKPFSAGLYSRADSSRVVLEKSSANADDSRTFYRYEDTFSRFSFIPIIRFDNYSKLNGSNSRLLRAGNFGDLGENLLRDMKTGIFFSSREVTDRLSLFGGALFGFGSLPADGLNDFFQPSRLTDLDRDLFLIAEYRGLPFIEKRWSPTISIELYNLRRNVRNGLEVEEFPCTACLPDTLSLDLAYNIWEANFFLRSKIDERSLLELGVGYSPYRVQVDAFFSRELQQTIPSTSEEYFKATTFSLAYYYENFTPYPNSDIAPVGWKGSLTYQYQPGRLLQDFEVEEGVLLPVYDTSYNHSVELNARYGFPGWKRSTGQIRSRIFSYINQPEELFYLDYIGGFTGMRSYPFFALGGTTTAFAQFSYITPLLTDINRQLGRHTLDKLFMRLYAETGGIWGNTFDTESGLKTGVGAELRFAFNSYYLYPLKLFVSGSYGFDRFTVTLPGEFITESGSNRIDYGRELLFHFGLTFDFNILNHE
ncbi:MAG: DPP IV N-terminal domain-containing protein, partial [Balneolaceae bacterium]|nr:DPP IV N-terminal domain-containing protein [Balneolaceae bacterium]